MKNAKDTVASDTHGGPVSPHFPLYDYQRQVLRDILSKMSTGERRVVAHLPTGAGKTRIASHAACRLLNDTDSDKALVIWLAATEELCEQAAEQLAEAWAHLGMRTASIHRYWGNWNVDLRNLPCGFLVTGLAKLRSIAFGDHTLLAHLAGYTAAVIFDEAHQAVAKTYSFVTEQLCSTRPALLGLTATPGRTADITSADYALAEMFNRTKVSIDPKGHGSPVTYLIQNQYLAAPHFIPISFEANEDIVAPEADADYSAQALSHLGLNSDRNDKIVELARTAAVRHQRTIVFCPSVESAVQCDAKLRNEGVGCAVITAHTPGEDRQAIIASFKSDAREHMVMFNYGVLTAGFDAPRTRCVIIARPTTSLVLYSQMAGRAMRGPRAGGNSTAEILTVVDINLPGFGSVTDAFTNWEELWKSS